MKSAYMTTKMEKTNAIFIKKKEYNYNCKHYIILLKRI